MKYSFVVSDIGLKIEKPVVDTVDAARKYAGKEVSAKLYRMTGNGWEIRYHPVSRSWIFSTDNEGLFTYVRMMV